MEVVEHPQVVNGAGREVFVGRCDFRSDARVPGVGGDRVGTIGRKTQAAGNRYAFARTSLNSMVPSSSAFTKSTISGGSMP